MQPHEESRRSSTICEPGVRRRMVVASGDPEKVREVVDDSPIRHQYLGTSPQLQFLLYLRHQHPELSLGCGPSLIPRGLNRTTSRPTSTLWPLRPTAPANEWTALVLRTECDPMKAILVEGECVIGISHGSK